MSQLLGRSGYLPCNAKRCLIAGCCVTVAAGIVGGHLQSEKILQHALASSMYMSNGWTRRKALCRQYIALFDHCLKALVGRGVLQTATKIGHAAASTSSPTSR